MRPEHEIAEAISATWHGANRAGVGHLEVPIGVVASVLVTSPHALDDLPKLTNAEFVALLRKVWGQWWLQHPHLAEMARPITAWLDEPSDPLVTAARAVADEAMRRQIKKYQGLDTDLLSYVVTELRSRGSRKALGEYHTPPDVCDTMAWTLLRELPEKGESFCEPTSGTGGMIRAQAFRIKQLGGVPADYVWHMADLDPIATACAAVNALVWNLGNQVYIYCGDTIAEGNTFERAVERRRDALQRWAEVIELGTKTLRWIEVARAVEELLESKASGEGRA